MTAGNLMTRHLFAVGPDTALATAARLMVERRISGVPVIDPEGHPIGVLSLSDLVNPDRNASESFGFDNYYELSNGEIGGRGPGCQLEGGRVKELMTAGVITISALATVDDAALLMIDHEIHRLLVMDGDRLLGILSSLDIARGLLTS